VLTHFSVPDENIHVLLDENATKQNVINELKWLATRPPGSKLLFTFSGHGSWILPKDVGGWVVCICCTDCLSDSEEGICEEGVITNPEFKTILKIIDKESHITSIIDSCFSGGMDPSKEPLPTLPTEVREILYGPDSNRRMDGERMLAGPEWMTINDACRKFSISEEKITARIKDGSIRTREVLHGPLHILF